MSVARLDWALLAPNSFFTSWPTVVKLQLPPRGANSGAVGASLCRSPQALARIAVRTSRAVTRGPPMGRPPRPRRVVFGTREYTLAPGNFQHGAKLRVKV